MGTTTTQETRRRVFQGKLLVVGGAKLSYRHHNKMTKRRRLRTWLLTKFDIPGVLMPSTKFSATRNGHASSAHSALALKVCDLSADDLKNKVCS